METSKRPYYKKIYTDILSLKYPDKINDCKVILSKRELSVSDIIKINTIIFSTKLQETKQTNSLHRSYGKADILAMLDYQKKYRLNNSQLAKHFNLSRNSVAKWKKIFLI